MKNGSNKIPKKIKIGTNIFDVLEVESNMFMDDDHLGECDLVEIRMKLLKILKESQKKETLMHEVFEAIVYQYGLDITHQQLSTLSTALTVVLNENEDLRRYLFDK